ncbi:unnamed protein product [Cuscuta epithymum]|uniref:J domain-containing protein n=1 Tax=Cuscuta epithymum TaxID=186058 RepID=A0AAV0F8F4_9ASTE|nr:unnamed protein product [Cuscuta epithymum]
MESLSRPSHRRKLNSAANGVSFSAKNAYDDVFSSTPKKRGPGSTRPVWDYAEIFGPSRGSSIPVLDLSVLEDRAGASVEDFRSSKIDYSNIFGGFADEDIALPYEDVIAKRGKQRSSSQAKTRSQESNHFSTSNETNEAFTCDSSSDQSFDGEKRVNMSYNKTSIQGTEDGLNGMTRIAQLHAVPGFTFFIDETARLKTTDGIEPPPPSPPPPSPPPPSPPLPPLHVKHDKKSFSGEIAKSYSLDGFNFSGNLSNPESVPSKVTNPPSSLDDETNLRTQTKSKSKQGVNSASPLSSDEELDVNSDAAVSAAALKRAMEKAQESIRLAKELMERYKEGIPGHQKQRSSKVGDDKQDCIKGNNSKNMKGKNTDSPNHHAIRNGDIASCLKQCEELSINGDHNSETLFFEMLNATKHEKWTVTSQHGKKKNKDTKVISEKGPDPRGKEFSGRTGQLGVNVRNLDSEEQAVASVKMNVLHGSCIPVLVMAKPGKSENMNVNNEFELSKERGGSSNDLENLEKMQDNDKDENFMAQELENDARDDGFEKPSKSEKEKLEHVECDELQKEVEVVPNCEKITRRVRKTWNKRETEFEHRGNGIDFWFEIEESCEGSHQVFQVGGKDGVRSNRVDMPDINVSKETERLDEDHVRQSDEVQEPETHALESSEKKTDEEEEHARVEESVQEIFTDEVSDCIQIEKTDERHENQHIEANKAAGEESEYVEVETDTDDEYQDINLTQSGDEEFESKDKEYQESTVILNREEETACAQSGANEVTLEAEDEVKTHLTSASNSGESCSLHEIGEECTSPTKEVSLETNEQNISYKENEGLQGITDIFSKEPGSNGGLQSAHESDICQDEQNERQDTSDDLYCDASGESIASMAHEQEIPNEKEGSRTDSLIPENLIQTHESVEFEKDGMASNTPDENVIGCNSDDEPKIQTPEEVIGLGEQIISENGKESEFPSNAFNGEYWRVDESAGDDETIKEADSVYDDEAYKEFVAIGKESSPAVNQKEQEPSHVPLTKNEESTVGYEEDKKIAVPEEHEVKKSGGKGGGDNKDQYSKVGVDKKERERDRERIVVERAIREARERAFAEARERAAVERATAEVRQRAMTEAREKAGKSSSSSAGNNKQSVGKASSEAKLRAERAAVERATAEARERALEKAMSLKSTAEVKVVAEKLGGNTKYSGASSQENGLKHSLSSSDLERISATNGSAQRRKAILERHQRITERAAKALAEKNMRDLLAQKEQAERNRLAQSLDAEIKRWASGKEGNLRALLSTLQYILGPDSGWQPISLTEIITTSAVKKGYRKATLCVHPDKLQQRRASIQQKYICEKVFDMLKAAWNKFNSEER